LIISQLTLEGIVRMETNNTMIAVVANPANRAYFLRQNDEVYNGAVTKITSDSVTFTEKYRDAEGRESTREVVKRLAPTPGVNP
jgi:Tfp pilus assembly protein PilP